MSQIKSPQEIQKMKEGGKKLAIILARLLSEVKAGVTPIEIDNLATKFIKETGGTPSFLTVDDYRWATCISVNEGVVHGIPTNIPFNEDDVVSIDIGLLYRGYHTDTSWSKIVQSHPTSSVQTQFKVNSAKEKFLRVGEEALQKAIKQARSGNRVGHISKAIQDTVENAGYSVVQSLVGHGIGKNLHESPQIPGISVKPISHTPLLKTGMTVAIEVIYAMGGPEISYQNEDNWTLVTKDKSLAGLFEQTVVIDEKAVVLTQS